MIGSKALATIWRGPSPVRGVTAAPAGPAIRCRHCGGSHLKLSYRRRERPSPGLAGGDDPQTTFILRCAGCEGFTTVYA